MNDKQSVALVIGGTSGIGLSAVKCLASNWRTYSAGRINRELIKGIRFLKIDVLDETSIRNAFQLLGNETEGELHALVYAAGITTPTKDISKFNLDEWNSVWNTNVTGAILALKYAYPLLRKVNGKVVIINSVAARSYSKASGFEYTTSKAALTGFAHQIAVEWASEGILVNSIYPGMTLTPMLSARLNNREIQKFVSNTPTGRLLTPEEIARAIEFLISPDNKQMTGASIDINGGLFLS